ncbi:RcpC/CpaB family pilus assembly protein [Streptomyces sp. NPDC003703]|uniref:RcpC/CpaB family pilus assembly protein n=1 Tax=Streptomyces sp. NPDC003283 TaxID=3364681 RepID=UPI0036C48AC5
MSLSSPRPPAGPASPGDPGTGTGPFSPYPPGPRTPDPVPGVDTPAPCEVPHFAPVRVRGGQYGLRRLLRHRRRAVAAGLAVTAAALVTAGPRLVADTPRGAPARGQPQGTAAGLSPNPVLRPAVRTMAVPVRIADAATVRLLRPGDRVDVFAVADPAAGGRTRVIARGARVRNVPQPVGADPGASAHIGSTTNTDEGRSALAGGPSGGEDALVTLAVPPSTAARLAGASASARLAVTPW